MPQLVDEDEDINEDDLLLALLDEEDADDHEEERPLPSAAMGNSTELKSGLSSL